MKWLLAFFPLPALAATVNITWTPPTQFTSGTAFPSGTAITYNVYGAQCTTCDSTCTPTLLQSADRYASAVLSNVSPGHYCYAITAIVNGVESVQSPLTSATISSQPNPVTNVQTSVSP